jgi:DNA-binding NarL/FixJ family response regulator
LSSENTISVVLVDACPVFRAGVKASIEPDVAIVGESGSSEGGLQLCRTLHPNIVLLDPSRLGGNRVATIKAFCNLKGASHVVVFTDADGDEQIYTALEVGARGYLLKSTDRVELVHTLHAVARGQVSLPVDVTAILAAGLPRIKLSSREIEVLGWVATGRRNKEIAHELQISKATVNGHVKHILEKLGAEDRTQAVLIGLRRGFLQLNGIPILESNHLSTTTHKHRLSAT